MFCKPPDRKQQKRKRSKNSCLSKSKYYTSEGAHGMILQQEKMRRILRETTKVATLKNIKRKQSNERERAQMEISTVIKHQKEGDW